MNRTGKTLSNDTSGAVVLIAVFMAVFLVSMLWYMIGIGNAIVYRETMLDGADATAYAAAVYDARGMNVIAMINLIMAAVMAVLVVVKLIQVLNFALNAFSCIACAIPFGEWACPICAASSEAEDPIANIVNDVQNVVNKVEPALHGASSVVAVGMPWIAEARSIIIARDYSPTVHGGLTISLSQLPGAGAKDMFGSGSSGEGGSQPVTHYVQCRDGSNSPTCSWEGGNSTGTKTKSGAPNMGGCCSNHGGILGEGAAMPSDTQSSDSSGSGGSGGGGRLGLPVQDDDPAVLCKAAAVIVKTLLDDTLGKVPLVGGFFHYVDGLLASLVDKFPSYFCGGGSAPDIKGAIGNQLGKYGLDPSKACTKQNIQQHNKNCTGKKGCTPYTGSDGGVAQCKAAVNKQTSGNDPNAGGENNDQSNEATKKIFANANMGDDYFAVFSIMWSDLGSGPDKGVSLASWGKTQPPSVEFFSKLSFAKAEFYYDIGTGMFSFQDNPDGKAQQIPDDAMWNMRWRARLRRMHDPIPNIGTDLANKINGKLGDLGQYLGGVSQAQQVLGSVEQATTNVGNQINQTVSQQISSMLGIPTITVVH